MEGELEVIETSGNREATVHSPAFRELTPLEIGSVFGGETITVPATVRSSSEPGGSNKDAASCMIGFGSLAVGVVAGVSGPAGWTLFGATAITTAMSCSPD